MMKMIIWGESEYTQWLKGLKMKLVTSVSMKNIKEGHSES